MLFFYRTRCVTIDNERGLVYVNMAILKSKRGCHADDLPGKPRFQYDQEVEKTPQCESAI